MLNVATSESALEATNKTPFPAAIPLAPPEGKKLAKDSVETTIGESGLEISTVETELAFLFTT